MLAVEFNTDPNPFPTSPFRLRWRTQVLKTSIAQSNLTVFIRRVIYSLRIFYEKKIHRNVYFCIILGIINRGSMINRKR